MNQTHEIKIKANFVICFKLYDALLIKVALCCISVTSSCSHQFGSFSLTSLADYYRDDICDAFREATARSLRAIMALIGPSAERSTLIGSIGDVNKTTGPIAAWTESSQRIIGSERPSSGIGGKVKEIGTNLSSSQKGSISTTGRAAQTKVLLWEHDEIGRMR